jgi:hypothetical protein
VGERGGERQRVRVGCAFLGGCVLTSCDPKSTSNRAFVPRRLVCMYCMYRIDGEARYMRVRACFTVNLACSSRGQLVTEHLGWGESHSVSRHILPSLLKTYYIGISSTMPLSSALCVSQCYEIWTSPRNHITPSFWLATEPQRHSTPRSIWGDEIRSHAAAQLAQRNNVAAQHRRAASLSALPRSPPPPAWLLRACGTSAGREKARRSSDGQ